MNKLVEKARKQKVGLVLGGGGARGAYECGVVKALEQLDIKADIAVGTSVGSLIAACYAENRIDSAIDMWAHMETSTIFEIKDNPSSKDYFREFLLRGGADSMPLRKGLDNFMSEKAIRKSSVEYGLVTADFPSMTPRYLWKEDIPEGRLLDFMAASCAAFPAVHTYEIDGKTYIDGGYVNNLPVCMAREKGAEFIIAVELDRHDSDKIAPGPPDETYILIKPKFPLGFILNFRSERSKEAMILGYLETLKAFGILSGDLYTFEKDEFSDSELSQLEPLCQFFEIEPTAVYNRESINLLIREKAKIFRNNYSKAIENRLSTLISFASFSTLRNIKIRGHVVLYILDSFKAYGLDSIFATKYLMSIIPDEIRAARYMLNNHIDA